MYVFLRYLILLQCVYNIFGADNVKIEFVKFKADLEKSIKVLVDANLLAEKKEKETATINMIDVLSKDKTFDTKEFAASLASGVAKGLGNLVKGIKSKQPYYVLSGIMSVLTSVTGLLGPFKSIADSVLALLTSVLDVFGKPATESQEDIFKRLLEDMSLKELKGEVEGMQLFYTTLSSQIKLLNYTTNKKTEVELAQLHTLSYENFVIFGEIEAKIKDDCKTKEESNKETTKRCMTELEMYVKLTLGRQMLLAQLASVSNTKKLPLISELATSLIEQAQTQDKKVLDFLTKPLVNVDYRAAIYNLYNKKGDHPLVVDYVKSLDQMGELEKETQTYARFDHHNAMFCDDLKLKGNCRLVSMEPQTHEKLETTKSIFVPPGLQVQGEMKSGILAETMCSVLDCVKVNKVLGPLHGIGVYSYGNLENVEKFQVKKLDKDLDSGITICKATKEEDDDDEWCQFIGVSKDEKHKLKKLAGRDFRKISTITIPDGYKVELFTENDNTITAPIYGQQTVKKFCDKTWEKIDVKKSDVYSSADFVVVCEEENFGGYCQQLDNAFQWKEGEPLKFGEWTKNTMANVKPYKDKNVCAVKYVQSMKIPAGDTLYLYDKKTVLSGPWTGPLIVPNTGSKKTLTNARVKSKNVKEN